MKSRHVLIFLLVVLCSVMFSAEGFAKKFDDKGFSFFEWHNPTPCFTDLGLSISEVVSIIGNNQMLILHKGRNVDVYTSKDNTGKGEIITYENLRFVTNLVVFNKPREDVIAAYIDYEKYPEHFSQYPEAGIIKSQGNQYLLGMKQVYKLLIFNLKADFRYLVKKEANGNLSQLLLDGDVGAGVGRQEFISVGEYKTLVVTTQWQDLDTARFVYRTLINTQPDIKVTAPLATSAMFTNQLRDMIEGEKSVPPNMECLPERPDVPVYATGHIPVKTFRKLTDLGTLTFVYDKQWIKTRKGPKCMEFISSATQIPGNIEKSKPISSDFTRLREYFKQAGKVEIQKKENGYSEIDWNLKIELALVSMKIDYTTISHWINDKTILFEGAGGDIEPVFGAWEWIDLENDNTMVIMTVAMNVGEKASWLVKLGRKIPNAHIVSSIFMSTLIVENQAEWVGKQLR